MASEKENKKEMQKKYVELQVLANQLKQMQAQVQALDEHSIELSSIVGNIEELKAFESGREILVPFSEGIFARANLQDSKELIVNVGSGILVRKSLSETAELLSKRISDINGQKEMLINELQEISIKVEKLEESLGAFEESS